MDTLNWRVEGDSMSFGTLMPFAGNSYNLNVTEEGNPRQFDVYIMDDSGQVVLARSMAEEDKGVISLTSVSLRNQFQKIPHEYIGVHVYLRSGGSTVASGDMFIAWNPLWSDGKPGPAYTVQGPPGDSVKGDQGDDGLSAYQVAVKNGFKGTEEDWLESLVGTASPVTGVRAADGTWHSLEAVETDVPGKFTLEVSDTTIDGPGEDTEEYVTIGQAQTITGQKTFSKPVLCETEAPPSETGNYLATVPWTLDKIKDASNKDVFDTPVTFNDSVKLTKGLSLPSGSTATTPTAEGHVATKGYADTKVKALSDKVDDIAKSVGGIGADTLYMFEFTQSSKGRYHNLEKVSGEGRYQIVILWYGPSTNASYYLEARVKHVDGSALICQERAFGRGQRATILSFDSTEGIAYRLEIVVGSSNITSAVALVRRVG